mmetsp:Transcript_38045/g.73680  ORF Transcript_38045/g.73680 Transcript_38045/m.73680 type:complete len:133 (+) Transcript_38045:1396-1794(+)
MISKIFRCETGLQFTHVFIIFTKLITLKIHNYNTSYLLQEYYFNKNKLIVRFIQMAFYFITLFKILKLKTTSFFHKSKSLLLTNNKSHVFASTRFYILSSYLDATNVFSYSKLKTFLLLWIFLIKKHITTSN